MDPRRSSSERPRAWFVPRTFRRFLEQSAEMRPISLRFIDPPIESAFQTAYYREILPYVRLAHILGNSRAG